MKSFYDRAAALVTTAAVLDVLRRRLLAQQHELAARWNEFQDLRFTRDRLWKVLRKTRQYGDLSALRQNRDEQCIYLFATSSRGGLQMVARPLVRGGSGLDNKGFNLSVTRQQLDGAVCVSVSGELDLDNVAIFQAQLSAASHDAVDVVLDLRSLRYLDSSGINALLEAERTLAASRRHIVLVGPSKTVRRILSVLDLERVMPVFASVDQALAYLRSKRHTGNEQTLNAMPQS